MLKRIQCTRPPGADMSSIRRTRLWAPSGGAPHSRGGEISLSLQVYRTGMGSSIPKAGLLNSKAVGSRVAVGSGSGVSVGGGNGVSVDGMGVSVGGSGVADGSAVVADGIGVGVGCAFVDLQPAMPGVMSVNVTSRNNMRFRFTFSPFSALVLGSRATILLLTSQCISLPQKLDQERFDCLQRLFAARYLFMTCIRNE